MSAEVPPAKYSGGLKVIATGLGRTGTASLKKALEILYGAPCYHMFEVMKLRDFDFWARVQQGRVSVDEMKEHMDTFAASCDYPSSPHWKLQLQAFPDAKLIHTTRSPDTWAVSVSETIFLNQPDNPSQPLGIKLLLHTLARGMLPMIRGMTSFNGDYSHANLVKFFKEYEKHVLAEAPRDKLLVFKATDGWGPLCAHLGLPVPDEPYPNINDAAEFKRKIVAMNTAGWCFGALVACSAAVLVRHALRHR